jgi:hypothetical protein
MPTVQVEAQLSSADLLKAAGQLSPGELEQFVFQLLSLQAQRKAPSLPPAETDLLLKINQGVPGDVQKRHDELVGKRQAETLTADEHDELLRLTDQIEKLEAKRIEYMADLAHLRQTTLTALMKDLGIQSPTYA